MAKKKEEVVEEKAPIKKVLVHIKSLPYEGRYGYKYRANTIVEVDEDEALQLIDAGIADFQERDTAKFVTHHVEPLSVEDMIEGIVNAGLEGEKVTDEGEKDPAGLEGEKVKGEEKEEAK